MTTTTHCLPVTTTWEILQRSRNEAAVQILASGLKSKVADLRHASLQAIARRNEVEARKALITNWDSYDERDIEFLRSRGQHFSSVCNEILAAGSHSEQQFALAAIEALDLHETLEEIVKLVIGPRSPIQQQASDSLLRICRQWGQQARAGKFSRASHRDVVNLMHGYLLLYHEHQNAVVIDAWLRLVHWDDSLQRGLLGDARLDAYWVMMERLTHSNDPAVLQLLAGYLGRATTPQRVAEIITERPEPELLIELAQLADADSMPAILRHLKRLPPLASIENLNAEIEEISTSLKHRLWLIVAASSENVGLVLKVAMKLASSGEPDSQRVAGEVLRHCRNNDLPSLVPALQNEQSVAQGQVTIGSLLREVATWVNGATPELQSAAKAFLGHFTVANLLAQVRVWPAQMCRAMAEIVKIVEPDVADVLSQQLQSPAPRRRLSALQVTKLLDCTEQVSEVLLGLLHDPRLAVRVSVIDLLGAIRCEPFEAILPSLLDDASTDIQDAARRAMRRRKRDRQQTFKLAEESDLAVVGSSLE